MHLELSRLSKRQNRIQIVWAIYSQTNISILLDNQFLANFEEKEFQSEEENWISLVSVFWFNHKGLIRPRTII